MHMCKVMLCIKKMMNRRTNGLTPQKQYAPLTSLDLGSITKMGVSQEKEESESEYFIGDT